MIDTAGKTCALHGNQNIVGGPFLRAAEAVADWTKMFGEPPSAASETAASSLGAGAYSTTWATTALSRPPWSARQHRARADPRHRTSPGPLDIDGLVAIYTYDDLTGPLARAASVPFPHPALTHGRNRVAHRPAHEVNHVGRADRDGHPRDR